MSLTSFLEQKVFAVVGVSADASKYGSKVYNHLKKLGDKTVFGVNPRLPELNGEKIFASLAECPVVPDVVSVIVPPKVGLSIVEECKTLGINKIWFQPGAESDEAIARCDEAGIACVHHQCILLQA
ncbi:CoA binding domain [Carpediemonas membranifera]|uniref:CoA binding domain n=1 Tax=Carpediemonas membranifera TaxID=201153 RepID=A0A8J6BZ03_9EUKA|nr:CoA binding domain [Carpediemonas membranifera]|eukprot:KAG9395046.1 CoA binding domain [Carpediemonas membranifera]